MPSLSETGFVWPTEALMPPQGDVMSPPHGAVMGLGVAGDAPDEPCLSPR